MNCNFVLSVIGFGCAVIFDVLDLWRSLDLKSLFIKQQPEARVLRLQLPANLFVGGIDAVFNVDSIRKGAGLIVLVLEYELIKIDGEHFFGEGQRVVGDQARNTRARIRNIHEKVL